MTFLKYMSPFRAVRDLRLYLARRKRHELWFLLLALAMTAGILFMFFKDSQFEKPYKPNIIYVESWPLTRSDAEIVAQQKIDQAKKEAERAEIERKQKRRQAEYKKIDDTLKQWGL